MSLRDRCLAFYQQQSRNAMLRQGDPVEDMIAFVMAENGRKAEHAFDDAHALVLYFTSPADRDEFVEIVHDAKPNMRTKRVL